MKQYFFRTSSIALLSVIFASTLVAASDSDINFPCSNNVIMLPALSDNTDAQEDTRSFNALIAFGNWFSRPKISAPSRSDQSSSSSSSSSSSQVCDVSTLSSTIPTSMSTEINSAQVIPHEKTKGAYSCSVCGYSSPYKSNVTRHAYGHDSEKRFQCPFEGCNVGTNRMETMRSHQRREHNHRMLYECDAEGCSFTTELHRDFYEHNAELRTVINMLTGGVFCQGDTQLFLPMVDSLLNKDDYMVLADYESYVRCQDMTTRRFQDPDQWHRMSILNVSRMGGFSSDRAISEYCRDIWKVGPVDVTI